MKERSNVSPTYKMRVCDALAKMHNGSCVKNIVTFGQDHIDVFAWEHGYTILYVVIENFEEFSRKCEELEIKKSWLAGERKTIVCPSKLAITIDLPRGYGLITADLEGEAVRLSIIRRGLFLVYNAKKDKDLLLSALSSKY